MNKSFLVSASLCVLFGLGCGDDSGDDGSAGAAGKDKGGSGSGAGSTAETAGAAGLPNIADLLTPMCDPEAESVTSCGGTDCPVLPDTAAMSCTINCCSPEDRCGTRVADTRFQMFLGTACTVPALPDTRCPSTTLVGTTLAGCCSQNACGQIVAGVCIAVPGARACDAPAEDAGI